MKLPPLPSLSSLKEIKLPPLPSLPSLPNIKLPDVSSLPVINLGDLKNLQLPAISLPSLMSIRSHLSSEEAKTAGSIALGVTACGAVLVLIRRADRSSPAVEIITMEELNQLHAGGILRDFGTFLITPTATAIRVTGYGDRIPTLPRGVYNLVRLTELNLSGNGLTQIPTGISKLKLLKNLDLSNNKLRSLPEDIGGLSALISFNAMGNQLTSLPESLGDLTALVRLGLKSNKLTQLPTSIGKLRALKELFLTDNVLESLPEEIGQCKALVKLQASHNALRSLPASLGSLPNLELLRVACCEITSVPDKVATAPALSWVSLASNPACKAPSSQHSNVPVISISQLEIGRKLGDGASGEVFAATWRGRLVALKLFRADMSPDGHSADEIAIACALTERHLVKVLAKLDAQSPLGIVMEYVEGVSMAEKPNSESLLRCRWAPEARFSLKYILNVASGVASALESMHSRGLIHGDVYAHNVLADAEGNGCLHDYGASFYCPNKASAAAYEGHEIRAFGLFVRDLVTRMDIEFENMENVLDAQKQMLIMVQQCTSGSPGDRPRMATLARKLNTLGKSSAASTPRITPRGGESSPSGKNSARSINGNAHGHKHLK